MCKALSMVAFGALACAPSLQAGILYSETFDTGGSLADYTGSGEIFASTATSGTYLGAASAGEMNLGLIANQAGTLTAYTDFGGAKPLLSMQLDFTLNSAGAASSAFQLYLGSFTAIGDFNPLWNIHGGDRNWAKLNVHSDAPNPVTARYPPDNSVGTNLTLQQSYTFTLFLNQSGSAQIYDGPDGGSHNLADNSWSFFVDTTLVADGLAKGTSGSSSNLSGMILHFGRNYVGGFSNIDLDNIIIRDDLLVAIPEPASLALFALGGLALLRARNRLG